MMERNINDNLEQCFEKLRIEITNTLLAITNNSVQQEALRNKIYSMLTDLRSDVGGNLKEAHAHFVRDVSSIIEGMLLPSMAERNVKRLCKNDAYRFLSAVEKLTEKDN